MAAVRKKPVFEELDDSLSKLLSSRWPTAEGEVTAASVKRDAGEDVTYDVEVSYKFSVGKDGPYVGIAVWTGALSNEQRAKDAEHALHAGRPVLVRYRPDDPSVNALDRSVWDQL